jgi:hypothetical protein
MGRPKKMRLQTRFFSETHQHLGYGWTMGFGNTRKKRTRIARLKARVDALMFLYPSYVRDVDGAIRSFLVATAAITTVTAKSGTIVLEADVLRLLGVILLRSILVLGVVAILGSVLGLRVVLVLSVVAIAAAEALLAWRTAVATSGRRPANIVHAAIARQISAGLFRPGASLIGARMRGLCGSAGRVSGCRTGSLCRPAHHAPHAVHK